ncbi:hypothetical protein [Ideonella dechloratans]|uniref:hypothetical protein n=1 Tax=Ideonella dechloratans TaxID=36863 RepID=UPI0035B2EB2D
MLANLWMLKAPNGMFWYAVDYLQAVDTPTTVLVRPRLLKDAKRNFTAPNISVRAGNVATLLWLILLTALREQAIYCPTPHPIPWIRNQLVTFHDAYPFEGIWGRVKLQLLRWGLATSKCYIGYINKSMALPYLEGMGVSFDRLIYIPNIPPPASAPSSAARNPSEENKLLQLAAFGTDSEKKRYPELLKIIDQSTYKDRIHLHLYGEKNPYVSNLQARFPDVRLTVHSASDEPIQKFLSEIDAVIGIALNEGFGRPIATALMQGIPCYLSKSQTFLEFFSELALFSNNIDELIQAALQGKRPSGAAESQSQNFLSTQYRTAIAEAIFRIRSLAESSACTDTLNSTKP